MDFKAGHGFQKNAFEAAVLRPLISIDFFGCISIEIFLTISVKNLSFIFLVIIFVKVGLLGMARVLQRDLNRIADTADTSSSEGLSYVLTGEASIGVNSSHLFLTCSLDKIFLFPCG